MSMNFNIIQNAIIGYLNAIADIGKVRAYPFRTIDKEEFEATFEIDLDKFTPVRAWMVSWEGATPSKIGAPLQTYFVNHTFVINGYVSYNKTSDDLIRTFAQSIIKSIMPHVHLGIQYCDATDTLVDDTNASISGFDHQFLGPVLCSTVRITVSVLERVMGVNYVD